VNRTRAELRFIVSALATWRIAHLLAAEDGPGDAVVRVRARLGESWAGSLMDCFACLSVWVAAPFGFYAAGGKRDRIPTWLGLAGAALLLESARAAAERRGETEVVTSGKEDGLGLLWREASGAPTS
jgi:hypothetical protein